MTRLLFQLGLRSSARTPGPVAVRQFSISGPSWRYPSGMGSSGYHTLEGAAFCKSAPVGHSEYCCTDCFRDQRCMVTHLLDRTQTLGLLTTVLSDRHVD